MNRGVNIDDVTWVTPVGVLRTEDFIRVALALRALQEAPQPANDNATRLVRAPKRQPKRKGRR